MGTMEVIRTRLLDGATPQSLVAEGFARSSVYTIHRDLDPKAKSRGQPKDKPENLAPTPSLPVPRPSLPPSIADDPEIIELQKEVAKAKLQQELAAVQGGTPSKQALAYYREERRQGFDGSLRVFIDEMVAGYMIDYAEHLDPRWTRWAQQVLNMKEPVSQPENRDGCRGFMDSFWEHIALEMAVINLKE